MIFPPRFRGRVESFRSHASRLSVTLVDVGRRKLVSASEIISLVPPPLLTIPQLAYEVQLDFLSSPEPGEEEEEEEEEEEPEEEEEGSFVV